MANGTTNSYETYTINGFIESNAGRGEITYHNFSIYQKIDDNGESFLCIVNNIIDDYIDELLDLCELVELTNDDQKKYFYNPGLLAFDLYGSVEMEFVILKLNGIIDPKDFDIKKIKLIRASTLDNILSDIYNAESSFISLNRTTEGIETV